MDNILELVRKERRKNQIKREIEDNDRKITKIELTIT